MALVLNNREKRRRSERQKGEMLQLGREQLESSNGGGGGTEAHEWMEGSGPSGNLGGGKGKTFGEDLQPGGAISFLTGEGTRETQPAPSSNFWDL